MNIDNTISMLREKANTSIDVYERRPGIYQLIIPILHEDGDMVDIYLQDSPLDDNLIRICDYGMAVMRLSYTYDINTASKKRIFNSILINNGVLNNSDNLYLDSKLDLLYENILAFVGCVQKICNMRYWSREMIRSSFYDDLEEYITTELRQFKPIPDESPMPNYDIISVDWTLTHKNRNFYLFGVRGNTKAKNTAISLLEIQKAKLPFISLVVHENMEELGKKDRLYLTKNADTQYPTLSDCREKVGSDILRLAA